MDNGGGDNGGGDEYGTGPRRASSSADDPRAALALTVLTVLVPAPAPPPPPEVVVSAAAACHSSRDDAVAAMTAACGDPGTSSRSASAVVRLTPAFARPWQPLWRRLGDGGESAMPRMSPPWSSHRGVMRCENDARDRPPRLSTEWAASRALPVPVAVGSGVASQLASAWKAVSVLALPSLSSHRPDDADDCTRPRPRRRPLPALPPASVVHAASAGAHTVAVPNTT